MEDKQLEHIEQCKEFADQFLYELVFDLEELLTKYSAKISFRPCYSIVIDSLNELKQIINLLKIWRGR